MNELSLFDTFFGGNAFALPSFRSSCAPEVDILQKKDRYSLLMNLPGRTENDVNITLKNDVLSIASVEKTETDKTENSEEECCLLRERSAEHTSFKRSFALPKDIDSDNVKATFKNGVLVVDIGRKEDAAEKRIAVQSA